MLSEFDCIIATTLIPLKNMGGTNSNMSQFTQRDSFSGANPLSFQPLAPYNVPSSHGEAVGEGINQAAQSVSKGLNSFFLSQLKDKSGQAEQASRSMLQKASADTESNLAKSGVTQNFGNLSDRPVPVPVDTSSTETDWLKKLIGYHN